MPSNDHENAVDVSIKSRIVTIKGPRGSIVKNLSHLNVEMRLVDVKENDKKVRAIRIRMWFGQYKQKCQVKTVHTLLNNMISGVREVSGTQPVQALSHITLSKSQLCVSCVPYLFSALIKLIINWPCLLGCSIQDETRLRSLPNQRHCCR